MQKWRVWKWIFLCLNFELKGTLGITAVTGICGFSLFVFLLPAGWFPPFGKPTRPQLLCSIFHPLLVLPLTSLSAVSVESLSTFHCTIPLYPRSPGRPQCRLHVTESSHEFSTQVQALPTKRRINYLRNLITLNNSKILPIVLPLLKS